MGERLDLIDYPFLLDINKDLEFFTALNAKHLDAITRNCNHVAPSLARLNLHEGYFFLSHFQSLSTTIDHNIYKVYPVRWFIVVERPHKE